MTDQTDRELRALREELARFNAHRFVRVQNSWGLMLLQALLRGMAVGLGTVIGASILVSALLYMLSQIDFLPIIGDWAKEIAAEIRASTGVEPVRERAAPPDDN
ncbi:MAG: DUF5665 domain-containing protein [Pseudomonadota bacterium]